MRRKFKLKNSLEQHIAVVLYFFEEQIQSNVGIIITNDLSNRVIWLYQNELIEDVISDLASRLGLGYSSYEEVN